MRTPTLMTALCIAVMASVIRAEFLRANELENFLTRYCQEIARLREAYRNVRIRTKEEIRFREEFPDSPELGNWQVRRYRRTLWRKDGKLRLDVVSFLPDETQTDWTRKSILSPQGLLIHYRQRGSEETLRVQRVDYESEAFSLQVNRLSLCPYCFHGYALEEELRQPDVQVQSIREMEKNKKKVWCIELQHLLANGQQRLRQSIYLDPALSYAIIGYESCEEQPDPGRRDIATCDYTIADDGTPIVRVITTVSDRPSRNRDQERDIISISRVEVEDFQRGVDEGVFLPSGLELSAWLTCKAWAWYCWYTYRLDVVLYFVLSGTLLGVVGILEYRRWRRWRLTRAGPPPHCEA
jgi:hypothetical protein